jgi:hypothetical protein
MSATTTTNSGSNNNNGIDEWAPVALSLCLVGASVAFSFWVAIRAFLIHSSRRSQEETDDKDETTIPTVNDTFDTNEFSGLEEEEDDDDDDDHDADSKRVAGDIEATLSQHHQQSNSVLLAWSGLSCTYEANKKGQKEVKALRNAFGQFRTGEVTAIMGPR